MSLFPFMCQKLHCPLFSLTGTYTTPQTHTPTAHSCPVMSGPRSEGAPSWPSHDPSPLSHFITSRGPARALITPLSFSLSLSFPLCLSKTHKQALQPLWRSPPFTTNRCRTNTPLVCACACARKLKEDRTHQAAAHLFVVRGKRQKAIRLGSCLVCS